MLRRPFLVDSGLSCQVNLPSEFEEDSDNAELPNRSSWQLLEDGVPLPRPHSFHNDVRVMGGGRHSHWNGFLLFSSSDNSDPQTNGRRYALRWNGPGPRPWLDQFETTSADHDRRRWRMPAAPVGKCEGVIALFGDSFCGSTLINCVLGAHSRIYGGSELRWLVETPGQVACAVCGSACRMWSGEALESARNPSTIYDIVSRNFGRPIVCDSSKISSWFSQTLTSDMTTAKVLITKHPVRHLASHLAKLGQPVAKENIDEILAHLRWFYSGYVVRGELRGARSKLLGGTTTVCNFHLRYEDFVADPLQSLEPILSHVGLQKERSMLNWSTAPAHHIGGNIAPLVQICDAIHPLHMGREKYRRRGIFLDDSYKEVLSPEMIAYARRSPNYQWLQKRFYPRFGLLGFHPRMAMWPRTRSKKFAAES